MPVPSGGRETVPDRNLRSRFPARPGLAPEVVVMSEVGSSGRIVALYAVLVTPMRSGLPA